MLVKNLYISIDPTHRIWMSDKAQFMPPVALGDVMRAATVGVVEVSNNAAFPVGTQVYGFGGVAEYYIGIVGATVFYKAGDLGLPLTADLSVCSWIVGLAAWHGVNKILAPDSNSIIAVSGAAGAVGSIVGQLCKIKGAKVVGIAGSDQKLAWMKNDLKFDAVINYKTQDVEKELAAFAPEGLTGYFDNVGGSVTDAVLMNLKNTSKVAVCGSISEYDDKWSGQKNWNMILMRRLQIQGLICIDHFDELSTVRAELSGLVKKGDLKYVEDIRTGLENYPSVVRLLMSGDNTGKLILQV
jgi:NADPH-dependent curcumin reductase CurA